MHLGLMAPLLQPPPLPATKEGKQKEDAPAATENGGEEESDDAEMVQRKPETRLEAASAAIVESSLRLLINLVAHGNGCAEALRALGGVDALQSGSIGPHSGFERVRSIVWKPSTQIRNYHSITLSHTLTSSCVPRDCWSPALSSIPCPPCLPSIRSGLTRGSGLWWLPASRPSPTPLRGSRTSPLGCPRPGPGTSHT